MRRHKESQRRHKHLRVVRRETARLCRELEGRWPSAHVTRAAATASDSSSSGSPLSAGDSDAFDWQKPRALPGRPETWQPQPKGLMVAVPTPPHSARTAGARGRSAARGAGARDRADARGIGVGGAALIDMLSSVASAGEAGDDSPQAALVQLVHRSCGVAARKLDKRPPRGQTDRLVQAYSPKAPGSPAEGHARTLRNPAVQAALAEALCQLVAEQQQE